MKKLLFCTHKVNRANIRRENRGGVEHIVLTSFTLPPDIVMNGVLYPSDEVEKSLETLNRTPVTVDHPEIDGIYVSANDPEVDFDYRFGAYNENARKIEDGRIALDKVINVQKALKTDKGKRLLDRINEVETSDNARPIHTSVGVFLESEEVELAKNNRGQEYTWIARDMVFDHDAILLDSVGASTPEQGTGIGVNKENVKVEHYVCSTKKQKKIKALNRLKVSKLSFSDIHEKLFKELNQGLDNYENYVEAVFDDDFIFVTKSGEMFRSNYTVDDKDNLSIQDTRMPVERVVEFKPMNPPEATGDNAMRDTIIKELEKLGVTVNAEISEEELMQKYNEAIVSNSEEGKGDDETEMSEVVINAVKELRQELKDFKGVFETNAKKELSSIAELIVNSGKYPELDAKDIKSLGIEKAKAMAANCTPSYSIGSTMQINDDNNSTIKTNVADLPE